MHKELKTLLGGISPEEDVKANAAHKARVLAAPATPAEVELHDAYLAEIRRRSDLNPASLDNRQRRVAMAMVALVTYRTSLDFLEGLDLDECGANEAERASHQERTRECAQGVAAAHFALGQFEEALAALPADTPAEVRALYAEFDAAEKGTDEPCDCPKTRATETEIRRAAGLVMVPIEENTEFAQGDFPNRRRGSWVWAIRCALCHKLTIRTTLTATAAHELRVTTSTDDIPTALAPRKAG